MASDATRVHVDIQPPRETPPASTHLPFVNANLHGGWKEIADPQPAKADNTRVAARPRAEKVVPPPRQQYFEQATTGIADARPIPRENQGQANINRMCQLDPFAAQVNGYHDMSLGGKPDWQRVGASPLEYTATLAHPNLFGAYFSGKGIMEAIHEPSALNIGMAALGTGSLLLGNAARLPNFPHGMHGVAEGAEQVHKGLNVFEMGGGVESLRETLHGGEK